jgi:hypothetical protein
VAALLCELVEGPAARAKIQAALAQWHAPKAAEQIAEIMLAAIARQQGPAAAQASKCSCGCADKSAKPQCHWAHDHDRFHFKRPMKTGEQIAGELAGRVSPATVSAATNRWRSTPPCALAVRRTCMSSRRRNRTWPRREVLHARSLPFFVIGRGSNLLVRDGGFRGVVICLAHASFSRIELPANDCIAARGQN